MGGDERGGGEGEEREKTGEVNDSMKEYCSSTKKMSYPVTCHCHNLTETLPRLFLVIFLSFSHLFPVGPNALVCILAALHVLFVFVVVLVAPAVVVPVVLPFAFAVAAVMRCN